MKADNYILVASDNSTNLLTIINELNNLPNYTTITVTSIKLLKQFIESCTPKLIIINFKNNNIELNQLLRPHFKIISPVLCLTNKYEKLSWSVNKIPIIVQPLEDILKNEHLLCNVKSILSLRNLESESLKNKTLNQKRNTSFITENKNLARYVLELDQKKELLKNMTDRIKELYSSVDLTTKKRLNSIINNIKLDTSTNHWDDFKIYFENINPGFINQLTSKYPCLTSKDIKYCCYLKMNMSNEDIRYILGINKDSVRTHKYRLKKKMILEKEQDLKTYISTF